MTGGDYPSVCSIHTKASPKQARTSAEIAHFPKTRLPELERQFPKLAADLIWRTFPAPSQNAVCERASRETGASPDTFERILSGKTARIDAKLLFVVLALYHARTGRAFDFGSLAVRLEAK